MQFLLGNVLASVIWLVKCLIHVPNVKPKKEGFYFYLN